MDMIFKFLTWGVHCRSVLTWLYIIDGVASLHDFFSGSIMTIGLLQLNRFWYPLDDIVDVLMVVCGVVQKPVDTVRVYPFPHILA